MVDKNGKILIKLYTTTEQWYLGLVIQLRILVFTPHLSEVLDSFPTVDGNWGNWLFSY